MATAVYVHNAVFGQPSTRFPAHGHGNNDGTGDNRSLSSEGEEEEEEEDIEPEGAHDHAALPDEPHDLGSSRAPSSSSPFSTTGALPRTHNRSSSLLANTNPPFVHPARLSQSDPPVDPLQANTDLTTPRLSTSSQATLVTSPLPWSHAQAQSRARYYARRSSAYQPDVPDAGRNYRSGARRDRRAKRAEGEDVYSSPDSDQDFQFVDLSTDTDTTNNTTAPVHVHTSAYSPQRSHTDRNHPYRHRRQEGRQEETGLHETTTHHHHHHPHSPTSPSPLPPGLPATTSRTAERRPFTPYPFPPISSSSNTPSGEESTKGEKRKARSSSKGRPKGRRRHDSVTVPRSSSYPPSNPPPPSNDPTSQATIAPTASNTGAHGKGSRRYLPPYLRKGRISNTTISRRARILILLVRLFVGVVLCGWAAYSCARYWLAYSEFLPVAVALSQANEVEDPPRSQYAFVLAIMCTVTTALLVLDSSYFLYFVLYPHDGRLLLRTPTVAPISRTDEHAPPDDAADDTDPPPPARPRPRPSAHHHHQQDDKFTAIPYRNSALSASSGYRRSRRLSKPRPDSFLSIYPPVTYEVSRTGGEEGAAREQAIDVDTTDNEASTRPPEPITQEQAERTTGAPPVEQQENIVPPPPSQYVAAVPSTAPGGESDPQVEKHSKRTYTLHLPSLCHESSISPLPFPPAQPVPTPTQRNTTQHSEPARRRQPRKWRKTRVFLHVVHWLTFIAFNIPGLVNVALVPVWYNPTQTTDVTGVNSPHRLSGLCEYSPDVLWVGVALPPSQPPPCAHTVPYTIWLWGAIGRVLVTFALSIFWIVMDGVWWGAWVVGTRRIGWKGALGRPWRPRRPSKTEQQEPEDDSEGLPIEQIKETPWAKRIRLTSVASKTSGKSGRSGRSGRSNKEKAGEFAAPGSSSDRGSSVVPIGAVSAAAGATSLGAAAGGITPSGNDVPAAFSSPASKYRVRRKPVRAITPPSSSSNSPSAASYSPNSPPISSIYGPGGRISYSEQSRTPGGGGSSRRPSTHDSIGGSTVIGSPPRPTYLPGSPPFTPASPPTHFLPSGPGSSEEHASSGAPGRRSMALEMVPELEPRSHDERESPSDERSPDVQRRYPDRPPSRLARYDDAAIFGGLYGDRSATRSPPSSSSPASNALSATRPGWTTDPNTFAPITSPDSDTPLTGRGYFMVGDGGFSAGSANDGAYDEDSYYPAISAARQRHPSQQAGPSGVNRATSPNSERSNSPNSYGHGQYAGLDVRVETPTNEGEDEYPPEVARPASATQAQWYMLSTSQQPMAYQHPLAQGIQWAMGHLPEPEREVRMLGSVVRRMSTIESFGSHERELSRRGSAATARTTQTGRGNSGGTAQREGTNGSGNSAPAGVGPTTSEGSGSGGHSERNPEAEASIGYVQATSPTEMSPI